MPSCGVYLTTILARQCCGGLMGTTKAKMSSIQWSQDLMLMTKMSAILSGSFWSRRCSASWTVVATQAKLLSLQDWSGWPGWRVSGAPRATGHEWGRSPGYKQWCGYPQQTALWNWALQSLFSRARIWSTRLVFCFNEHVHSGCEGISTNYGGWVSNCFAWWQNFLFGD